MSSEEDERLATELDLLTSMYPDQIKYSSKGRELCYTAGSAALRLRLPDGYLRDALPDVVSASVSKDDLRDRIKEQISQMSTSEEILDSIISIFNDLSEDAASDTRRGADINDHSPPDVKETSSTTIIVWLHHLLNTNKRKQCLHPPSPGISGITKPGYPGVLIYSGPSKAVHEHVNELKGLNWAAFQVRLEEDGAWTFKHGQGVVEVESMGEVVAEIEVQPERKVTFLEAMKMK